MISIICSMRYKRILSVILVLFTLCSVFLCSCSKKDASPSVTSEMDQSSDTDTKRNDTSTSSVLFTNISADDTVINPYILKDQSTVCFCLSYLSLRSSITTTGVFRRRSSKAGNMTLMNAHMILRSRKAYFSMTTPMVPLLQAT